MNPVETKATMVPMDVEYVPCWLTWLASTTGCLRALDVDCDLVDVAGLSGYAFMLSVHEVVCPSGPTMFDWGSLLHGVHILGRTTHVFRTSQCHGGDFTTDLSREHCKQAYEFVSQEISEGRPCVMFGAYVPEFAVAIGVDDGKYIVKSFKEVIGEEQPPIPYDALEAPGGVYVLAFPGKTELPRLWGIRHAIGHAVQLLLCPTAHSLWRFGLKGYDMWIKALKEDIAIPFGNAYNAQCYANSRRLARDFLERTASEHDFLREPLTRAYEQYKEVSEAMAQVAEIFPFPPSDELKDEKNRKEAIKALKAAKKAEKKAVEALIDARDAEWPKS